MNIHHEPQFDVEKVQSHYTEKDGVEVKYVCTTDLRASDVPVDVYYRATPHPEFGNRYFGLYQDYRRGHMMITNADIVEELEFGMVKNDSDEWQYSISHHDYRAFDNGNMIDGGRAYVRSSNGAVVMRIIDGKFIAKDVEDLIKVADNGRENDF